MRRLPVKVIGFAILTVTLFSVHGVCQKAGKSDGKSKVNFPDNRCFSKGGLGIINTDLYIVVKSLKNELVLSKGKNWTGQGESARETVIFFDNRIWSAQALPDNFDMTKAVIISFEGSKVRFFDFGRMSGCYYERLGPN